MEATVEPPSASKPHFLAEAGKPYRFTSENAAEMGKRRWERNQPDPEATRLAESQAEKENERAQAIKRKVKQMAKFDDMIDKETDAKELHMLTASRERIFREWCALTRNPISGTFKATPEKPNSRRGTFVDPT